MAKVTHVTKIHRPNRPPIEIEHTSGLEEKGALAVLVALGYMATGEDQVWYARDHLTIIENRPSVGRLLHRPGYVNTGPVTKPQAGGLPFTPNDITDV